MSKKTVQFVDIHSHILPGIDDGSSSMEETEKMLRMAYEQGIRTIVATPHYDKENHILTSQEIQDLVNEVQKMADEILPGMTIWEGSEVLYDSGVLEDLKMDKISCIGNARCILVEFYPHVQYNEICKAVYDISSIGYTPLLAHVERYDCLLGKIDRLSELVKMGAYLQVNSRSLLGSVINKQCRLSRKMVLSGYVHFLGTDCHDSVQRTPVMKEAYKILCKIGGSTIADKLLYDNPIRMLKGEYI